MLRRTHAQMLLECLRCSQTTAVIYACNASFCWLTRSDCLQVRTRPAQKSAEWTAKLSVSPPVNPAAHWTRADAFSMRLIASILRIGECVSLLFSGTYVGRSSWWQTWLAHKVKEVNVNKEGLKLRWWEWIFAAPSCLVLNGQYPWVQIKAVTWKWIFFPPRWF